MEYEGTQFAGSKENKQEQKNNAAFAAAAAGAAGGFVAGAVSGAATSAAAAAIIAEPVADEAVAEDAAEENETLTVDDEGLRVAHVDAHSFSEAFAQARQQVGPGGVFEYNGRIYGTYYADEWKAMSADERAEFQHRAGAIAPEHPEYSQQSSHSGSAAHHPEVAADAQMLSVEPVEGDVRVLSVETVDGPNGGQATMVTVEIDGSIGVMLDVDNDDIVDVLISDDNHDQELQDSEWHDVHASNIHVSNLEHMQAVDQGNLLYASQDGMPDYVNDADSIMNV